ncbi:peptidase E [Agrococcus versicolor]|uniref:Peptidase E n=1 Tax=Agrococcus versicolor TaxID=501482 RepID=A0ABP5M959_9MICO
MRYLLTSAGVTNDTVRAALDSTLPRPVAQCSALVIPTAGHWFDASIAADLVTGAHGGPFANLGWGSLGVLELTALPTIPEEAWLPRLRSTDVLLVGGGDPTYLAGWMRRSGFLDALSSLRDDVVYAGLSAGSQAVGASLGLSYNGRRLDPEGPEAPLGLVDLAIYPHLEDPEMDDTRLAAIAAWARDVPCDTYAIDDETAVVWVDGVVEVVSEGRWERIRGTRR